VTSRGKVTLILTIQDQSKETAACFRHKNLTRKPEHVKSNMNNDKSKGLIRAIFSIHQELNLQSRNYIKA
jgi:hypothetical protein